MSLPTNAHSLPGRVYPAKTEGSSPVAQFLYFLVVLFLCLLLSMPTRAQRNQHDPLTDNESEQIREAGIDPDLRVSLYTKFLDERADSLKSLGSRAQTAAWTKHMDESLEDFANLMDELGSNLDQYGDRKADMRKSLKKLSEDCPRWQTILEALPNQTAFDVSREDAIESNKDLTDQTKTLFNEQTAYFIVHKEDKGQQRAEPK
jgi:hypothetical protein